MIARFVKAAVLVVVVCLIAGVPALIGCGQEKTTSEIVIGYMGDLTGPAAFGIKQVYDTVSAYLEMVQDQGVLPGVKTRLVSYDTRGDASRVAFGYLWLRDQGARLMIIPSPAEAEAVGTKPQSDGIALVGAPTSMGMLDCPWYHGFYGPPYGNVQVLMLWASGKWQSQGQQGKPKVGLVSYSGIDFYEEMLDGALATVALYPDKFDWVSGEMSPKGTMTWSIEIGRLMKCDYIVMGLTGAPLAAFIKEARTRGYSGKFIGPVESFGGYWSLLKSAVPKDQLDGIVMGLYCPWWNDDVPFINECRERVVTYMSSDEAQSQLMHANAING
ncbi:MAG: ABC transporter substrate-binding protein [Chloroflexi bacterium]|nr:ABC transporter substrate-binding protein [Chloroflexota bacterium]